MNRDIVHSFNTSNCDDSTFRKLLSRIVWGLTAAACLALSIYLVDRAKYSGEDSWFPMTRALDLLHKSPPGPVYENLFFSGHIKFQYPPSSLLLIDLLRNLGLTTSGQYNIINAGLLIVAGLAFSVLAVRTLGPVRFFGFRFPVAPTAFLIAVLFYPNRLAFQLGQMQVLLGLLVLLACLALLNERRVLCGCLIAAAATVKPQLLL
jgi:alpha-1,2-mannosyltransferase